MEDSGVAATKTILQENPSFYSALVVSYMFFVALSLTGVSYCKSSIKGFLTFMAVAFLNLLLSLGTLYICAYWLKGLKISIVYCLKLVLSMWMKVFTEYLTYYLLSVDPFSNRKTEMTFTVLFVWYYLIYTYFKMIRPLSY